MSHSHSHEIQYKMIKRTEKKFKINSVYTECCNIQSCFKYQGLLNLQSLYYIVCTNCGPIYHQNIRIDNKMVNGTEKDIIIQKDEQILFYEMFLWFHFFLYVILTLSLYKTDYRLFLCRNRLICNI
ncbi:hypothetical protein BpHYR1_051284 [Brachionus plicatilis]|uniref:Uncharacterized protein n=1 Tax=Brachionus plicatilis TaxID=10195 RepID=A0A3M7S856_BRAPC|nr:hypothetical protein BpHYR1_051284 [Brachionus plicatilis]